METASIKRFGWLALKVGGAIVAAYVVVKFVLLVLGLTFGWSAYDTVTEDLTQLTGLSRYVIAALAWLAFAVVTGATIVVRSRVGRLSIAGTAVAVALLAAVYQLGLFSLTTNTNFDNEGRPRKFYAITADGVVLSDRAGIEKKSGKPFLEMTPEMVVKLERLQRGEFEQVDPDTLDWFNPFTGDPKLWYHRHPVDGLQFFEFPGYHPGNRAVLEPVTPALKAEYEAARRPPPPPPPVAEAPTATLPPAPPARRPRAADDSGPRRAPAKGPIHSY